jgi:hypothetical protein
MRGISEKKGVKTNLGIVADSRWESKIRCRLCKRKYILPKIIIYRKQLYSLVSLTRNSGKFLIKSRPTIETLQLHARVVRFFIGLSEKS